jgi:hypothetical protein
MRFNPNHAQVFAVTRPVSRRGGVLAGLGVALDTMSIDAGGGNLPGMPPLQDSTPMVWDQTPDSTDSPANYDAFNFDYANYQPQVDYSYEHKDYSTPVEQPEAEKSTDWGAIFGTSAKALATITPAVTGIMAQQQQNKAQQAANDLALAQAQLAAQSRSGYVSQAVAKLPSWVIPAALGGVVLLAAGFFLIKMPRSRPAAPPSATNPRRRRRRSHR